MNSDVVTRVPTLEAAARAAGAAAPFLPPSLRDLFDPHSVLSQMLFDEYVFRLTVQVVREARLDVAPRQWMTADERVAKAGLEPRRSAVPVEWMLRHLAARGLLEHEDGRFMTDGALPIIDAAELMAAQTAHDAGCLPSYTVAAAAARDYPAFLRGERTGEGILLAPARLPLWTHYFSNDNTLYALNNRVGAAAIETWMDAAPATILELGGGLGSGTAAVLERLSAGGRLDAVEAYRFTELVPPFLRRAERLANRFPGVPLTFTALDMDRPFGEQGVPPSSVSIVYAVNTLHVAYDLAFTLAEIRRALRAGGQLIICECVRPRPGQTVYPEFIFNLMERFRAPRLHAEYRPNGGFLTPEQWTASLSATGFTDVRIFPDIARIRDVVRDFDVAAIGAISPPAAQSVMRPDSS
jgi:SAM-dependent methyltransferase